MSSIRARRAFQSARAAVDVVQRHGLRRRPTEHRRHPGPPAERDRVPVAEAWRSPAGDLDPVDRGPVGRRQVEDGEPAVAPPDELGVPARHGRVVDRDLRADVLAVVPPADEHLGQVDGKAARPSSLGAGRLGVGIDVERRVDESR